VVAVRVLDCDGAGSISDVIAGVIGVSVPVVLGCHDPDLVAGHVVRHFGMSHPSLALMLGHEWQHACMF